MSDLVNQIRRKASRAMLPHNKIVCGFASVSTWPNHLIATTEGDPLRIVIDNDTTGGGKIVAQAGAWLHRVIVIDCAVGDETCTITVAGNDKGVMSCHLFEDGGERGPAYVCRSEEGEDFVAHTVWNVMVKASKAGATVATIGTNAFVKAVEGGYANEPARNLMIVKGRRQVHFASGI